MGLLLVNLTPNMPLEGGVPYKGGIEFALNVDYDFENIKKNIMTSFGQAPNKTNNVLFFKC